MTREQWREYFDRLRPYRGRMAVVTLLSIVQAALLLPVPLLLGLAIDDALPEERLGLLTAIVAGMAALAILSVGLGLISRWLDLKVTKTITRDLRVEVLDRIFRVPRRQLDRTPVTTLHDRMVNDTRRLDAMTSVMLTDLLPDAVVAAGLTAILLMLDWQLALVTLAFAPALVVVSRLVMRRLRPLSRAFHAEFAEFSSQSLLQLRSQDLIRLAASEDTELEAAAAQYERVRSTSTAAAMVSSVHGAAQQAVIALAGSALLLVGGAAVINASMTLGELLSFYAAFAMLRGPASGFARSYTAMVNGQEALVRILAFLHDPAERPYSGSAPIELRGSLELRGVTFGYDPADPVVIDLDLVVEPGTVTALVGPNGSGKSSVVNLLLGFYRPDEGMVLADGRPYEEIDITRLRTQLGVVRQEPFLLPGTVLENIVYGRDLSDEQVRVALEASGADRVVERLDGGLDARVGDDGLLLSGGQRQRIAIARALAGHPRVLILDEPTNHLDEDAIAHILKEISRLGEDLSILLISHQHHVTAHADHVVHL